MLVKKHVYKINCTFVTLIGQKPLVAVGMATFICLSNQWSTDIYQGWEVIESMVIYGQDMEICLCGASKVAGH